MVHRLFRVSFLTITIFIIFIVTIHTVNKYFSTKNNKMNQYEESEFVLTDDILYHGQKIDVQLLTPNDYSRPQTKIRKMNGIVIHYVGNPMTTAQNNRNYFEGLSKKGTSYASSHFIVGLEGEIIQCIPLNEIAYCSNERNDDTIAIEVCHEDATGQFNEASYESVVDLVAYLCQMFDLTTKDVIRHYDVTEKRCPLYYVDHEEEWVNLKEDVESVLNVLNDENKRNMVKMDK